MLKKDDIDLSPGARDALQVWLDHLAAERDPHAYDLCDRHAGRLTAPQGWQVRDRRPPSQPALIAV